jgi:hypothetical protein
MNAKHGNPLRDTFGLLTGMHIEQPTQHDLPEDETAPAPPARRVILPGLGAIFLFLLIHAVSTCLT